MKTQFFRVVSLGLVCASLVGCFGDPTGEAALARQESEALSSAWTPEQVLVASSSGATNVRVALNAGGLAVAVWDEPLAAGVSQVLASVRSAGAWSAPSPLSSPALAATNAGAVVDDAGNVTVLWSEGGALRDAVWSGGAWSPSGIVPSSPGFDLVVGVGVDRLGNVQLATAVQRTFARPATFEAEALIKPAGGAWGAPAPITDAPVGARPVFTMNSSGQGLVSAGLVLFRSPSLGVWGPRETITPSGGTLYASGAALDAGGRGYFFFVSRYGGTNLSTSVMGGPWSKPKTIAKFATLGSSVGIAASSDGHALVYGVDYTTNKGRASASADGGKTWGALNVIGPWTDNMSATGSDSGLYALSYDSDSFWVATGSGLGTATAAWTRNKLAPDFPQGSAAISGAEVVAAWSRLPAAGTGGYVVGAATGAVTP